MTKSQRRSRPTVGAAPSDADQTSSTSVRSRSAGKNSNLVAAKSAKNDEFYTQWADIEREMNAYLEFDPNVFQDKVVLLPCDDPEWSNFSKFFALHFMDYGIKKLISTSYAADSNPADINYQPTLFESMAPQYDEARTRSNGKLFVIERKDVNGDGVVNIDDLRWDYLDGDGDFRSAEVTALRGEADVVITNPPFSLIREFISWLVDGAVKFSIIGPSSAVTYNEIFPLIKGNRVWLGQGFAKGDAYFRIPLEAKNSYATGVYDTESQLVHFRNLTWFTNIEHGRRHEPLKLMTMADNLRYNKKLIKALDGQPRYLKYDTYDAIEVPFISAIPSDYPGAMGVPISFLDTYNPDQFEILFNPEDMAQTEAHGVEPLGDKRVADYKAAGGTAANSPGRRKLFLYHPRPYVPYKRIIIRRKDMA